MRLPKKNKPANQRGQIVVEYVLLLSIAVTVAMIIVSQLINRDQDEPENSGAIIKKWQQMQDAIAKDVQN
jgi:hypothetical protein